MGERKTGANETKERVSTPGEPRKAKECQIERAGEAHQEGGRGCAAKRRMHGTEGKRPGQGIK